eukprot:TRINITY_DN1090_c0_g7_i2.p5 TRINITY_DN1090_c0_g7~~TRINITY_DN1090_c0_g7_i2.p5  ORF type:complete len:108 (-),score=32.88 TRINITY_DN1090_c0_g7_i2:546-869(-)
MPRVELLKDRMYRRYGFSLTAQETTLKFLTPTKENALELFSRLKRMCEVVGTHISKDYVLGRVVSRSSYWKMRMATNAGSETSGKYSVKSVLKSKLLDNAQSLVFDR